MNLFGEYSPLCSGACCQYPNGWLGMEKTNEFDSEVWLYKEKNLWIPNRPRPITKLMSFGLLSLKNVCAKFNISWSQVCTGKSLSEALLFAEHGENMLCTLQMLTDKLLINYYFHMLLLQVKMCKLFKGGWLLILQTGICFFCCLIQNYIQTTDR